MTRGSRAGPLSGPPSGQAGGLPLLAAATADVLALLGSGGRGSVDPPSLEARKPGEADNLRPRLEANAWSRQGHDRRRVSSGRRWPRREGVGDAVGGRGDAGGERESGARLTSAPSSSRGRCGPMTWGCSTSRVTRELRSSGAAWRRVGRRPVAPARGQPLVVRYRLPRRPRRIPGGAGWIRSRSRSREYRQAGSGALDGVGMPLWRKEPRQ